jgi:hypothetical protein
MQGMSDALEADLRRIAPSPLPTPIELALIAAPLLAAGRANSRNYDVVHAVFEAHRIWLEAHRFCEALEGRSAAGKEGAP